MRTTLLSLVVCSAFAVASSAEVTEPFSQTVPLTANGSFSIENVNGSISLETWDRNEVEILATRKAPDAETLERVKIEVEAEPSKVSVSTEYEGHTEGASVEYKIRAPRGASLDLDAVNGAIRVLNPAGAVDAESVNGSIEIGDASGPVSAESVNGAVEVGYVSLAAGKHDYEAVNGSLTLRMPGTASASFQAETVNGDINTDFPLEVRKAKYGPQRSLSGTLGSGGPQISLETVNGAIEIRAGGESVATRIRYHLDQVR
jgi:DUF4097 and DUF4098 domain-containing protein YvlB